LSFNEKCFLKKVLENFSSKTFSDRYHLQLWWILKTHAAERPVRDHFCPRAPFKASVTPVE